MANPYKAITTALRERLSIIADREAYAKDPARHFQQLKEVSEQIIVLQGTLPLPVDPQLVHYFQRCSYDKALHFLEALEAPGTTE